MTLCNFRVAIWAILGYGINCCKAFIIAKKCQIISAVRCGCRATTLGGKNSQLTTHPLAKCRNAGWLCTDTVP